MISAAEVRARRLRLGLTTERLALQAGLAALTVCRFETGAVRPRAGTAIALRRALERLEGRNLHTEAC